MISTDLVAARTGVAVAAVAIFLLASVPSQAQSVDLEVCNQTGARIDVAVGGLPRDQNNWAAVGWFGIEGGDCGTLAPVNFAGSRYVYVYAKQASTGLVWSGETNFCIQSGAFVLGRTDPVDCKSYGGEWVGFFEVDVGNDLSGTVMIGN